MHSSRWRDRNVDQDNEGSNPNQFEGLLEFSRLRKWMGDTHRVLVLIDSICELCDRELHSCRVLIEAEQIFEM